MKYKLNGSLSLSCEIYEYFVSFNKTVNFILDSGQGMTFNTERQSNEVTYKYF